MKAHGHDTAYVKGDFHLRARNYVNGWMGWWRIDVLETLGWWSMLDRDVTVYGST